MLFYLHFCILSIICLLFVKAIRPVITGGTYQKNTYMNAYVILGIDNVGPKMCVADCLLYKGCNAVNFNKNKLNCEFLTVSYPGDQSSYSDGIYFTEVEKWSKEQNQCWPNPCTGRTKCLLVYNGGHVCVKFDTPCDLHGCRNNGVCRNEVKGYRCLCPAGYHGKYCENTPCTGRTCYNDGSCVITGSSWVCSCPSGYYGSLCQNTPCTDKSCYNSGTCVITGSSWSCDCKAGYSGSQCQTYTCDFETEQESGCLFDHDPTAELTLQRHQGSTPSSSTGPTKAYKGSYYLYLEATGVAEGDKARLIWKTLQINCGGSISMCYHMYGSEMGTLKIYQDGNVLWQKSGDQGNSWKCDDITLAGNTYMTSEITIEAKTGSGFRSDIAIDNIILDVQICETK